jgi:predicted dehydrogenase
MIVLGCADLAALFHEQPDLDPHWFSGPTRSRFAQERGTLEAFGMKVHDCLNALIQFEGGVSANFHSSWIYPNTYPRVADGYLQIIGSEGALTYHARTRTAELYNAHGGQEVKFSGRTRPMLTDGKITGHSPPHCAFRRCIREDASRRPPRRVLPTAEVKHRHAIA